MSHPNLFDFNGSYTTFEFNTTEQTEQEDFHYISPKTGYEVTLDVETLTLTWEDGLDPYTVKCFSLVEAIKDFNYWKREADIA